MLDLYLLITPLFAFLSLLTLINLKLSLAEPNLSDLPKYHLKSSSHIQTQTPTNPPSNQHHHSPYLNTLKYLLKNYTFVQFCSVRRSINKIPFFLSISVLALSSIFIKTQAVYLLASLGFLAKISYILLQIISFSNQSQQILITEQKKTNNIKNLPRSGQKLEIIFTFLTLLMNLTIIWLLYRNTNNSQILAQVYNFLIIFAADNLILGPLMLSLFSFPLNLWSLTKVYFAKQTQITQILHGERELKREFCGKFKREGKNKIQNTTSNTQNTIEIEPCVNFDLHGNNMESSEIKNKNKSKCSLSYKKSDGKYEQSQSSLIKYVNYPFKNIQPNAVGSKVCNLRKIQFDQKIMNENTSNKKERVETHSLSRRRNKLYSQRISSIPELIQTDLNHTQNAQNQQENHPYQNQSLNQVIFLSVKKNQTSRNNQSGKKYSEKRRDRNSLQKNVLYHSNQKVYHPLQQQNFSNSCVSGFNLYSKPDLLKIQEDKHAQDLEQIDMNSPERTKNQLRMIQVKAIQQRKMSVNQDIQNLKIGTSKIFKKFSLDQNHQSVSKPITQLESKIQESQIDKTDKFQWKDCSNKRKIKHMTSQLDLSRKSDIFARFSNDSRATKSLKRTKNTKDPIVRENDQNQIPQFIIHDFTL